MTKLSEAENKALMMWNVVVDALLGHIEHHRDGLLAAYCGRDLELGMTHLKAMHRAAKTLAVFTDPNDD